MLFYIGDPVLHIRGLENRKRAQNALFLSYILIPKPCFYYSSCRIHVATVCAKSRGFYPLAPDTPAPIYSAGAGVKVPRKPASIAQTATNLRQEKHDLELLFSFQQY